MVSLFLHLLLLLLKAVLFNGSLDLVVSLKELILDFGRRYDWAIEPRMALDFSQGQSLGGIVSEERVDEVHEVLGVEGIGALGLDVSLPEGIVSVRAEELVVGVFRVGLGERRGAGEHDEEDDGGCEQIDGRSVVGELRVDFRRHVALGSQAGLEQAVAIAAFHEGCETEIGDFQIEMVVEEQVLRFQVSVRDVVAVHVLETTDELVEVRARDFLGEAAAVRNVFEELTTSGVFEHDAQRFVGLTVLLRVGSV